MTASYFWLQGRGIWAPERESRKRWRWAIIRSRSQRKFRRGPWLALGLILALSLLAAIVIYPLIPTRQTAEWATDGVVLVVGGQRQQQQPLVTAGDDVLLCLDAVQSHIDPYAFWEPEYQTLTLSTANAVLRMNTGQLTAHINRQPLDLMVPVQVIAETPYIPLAPLVTLYGLEYAYHPQTETVVLDQGGTPQQTAVVVRATGARVAPAVREPILAQLAAGERVVVVAERAGWYRLQTAEGIIGYADKSDLRLDGIDTVPLPQVTSRSRWRPMGEPIAMVWDYIGGTGARAGRFEEYPDLPGVNVISPTWFHLIDNQGTLSNYADAAYVDWAHRNGMAVWALVSNGFDPDRTQPVLRDPALRARVVDQLLAYAAMYKFDGINIDFENMYMADRDHFSQFVRELALRAHEQGLVISVDVTAISGCETWSRCYDRAALAEAADYLVLMAYDQHPATSQVAGPVAGLDWTERSLQQVLEQVPSNKLILGMPFYTRLWREQLRANGSIRVSSLDLGMEAAWELVAEQGAATEMDPGAGATHAWYQRDGSTYRIWIEDADTVRLRAELANRYGLPGVAAWRLGLEAPGIWQIIDAMLTAPPPPEH